MGDARRAWFFRLVIDDEALMVTQLSNEQVNRYKRHLILPEVGVEGQKRQEEMRS